MLGLPPIIEPKFERLKDKAVCTKAWMACRAGIDLEKDRKAPASGPARGDTLDDNQVRDITAAWHRLHNIHLSTDRLLIPTLYTKHYREVKATPRRLSIILPETL